MNYEELKEKKPLRRGEELGRQGEYIVIANEQKEAYGLTPAIYYVWRMCDGEISVEEMVNRISEEAEIKPEELQEPLAVILSQLQEAGLVRI